MKNAAKVQYEFAQAEECLAAGQMLAREGYYNSSCNRLYYAVFHAAKSLMLAEDRETKSHKGLFNQFGLLFVQTGVFSKEENTLYRRMIDARDGADYGYLADFTEADARAYLPRVEAFLAKAKSLLDFPDA